MVQIVPESEVVVDSESVIEPVIEGSVVTTDTLEESTDVAQPEASQIADMQSNVLILSPEPGSEPDSSEVSSPVVTTEETAESVQAESEDIIALLTAETDISGENTQITESTDTLTAAETLVSDDLSVVSVTDLTSSSDIEPTEFLTELSVSESGLADITPNSLQNVSLSSFAVDDGC